MFLLLWQFLQFFLQVKMHSACMYCCVLPHCYNIQCLHRSNNVYFFFQFSQIVCDKKGCHHVSCNMCTHTHMYLKFLHFTKFNFIKSKCISISRINSFSLSYHQNLSHLIVWFQLLKGCWIFSVLLQYICIKFVVVEHKNAKIISKYMSLQFVVHCINLQQTTTKNESKKIENACHMSIFNCSQINKYIHFIFVQQTHILLQCFHFIFFFVLLLATNILFSTILMIMCVIKNSMLNV